EAFTVNVDFLYWHKGCFSCEVCKMTLNMKNYKGFEKRPYCNALQFLPLLPFLPPFLCSPRQQKQGPSEPVYYASFRLTGSIQPQHLLVPLCKQASPPSQGLGVTVESRHYPKTNFTCVADTPENLRLKQQSQMQSQADYIQGGEQEIGAVTMQAGVRYREDFEKNKGKGFSVVTDTPELQRIKKSQNQISNSLASLSLHKHSVIHSENTLLANAGGTVGSLSAAVCVDSIRVVNLDRGTIKYHEDFEKRKMGGEVPFQKPSNPSPGAFQPPAASQNFHYEPAPEPVQPAAAAPPPSSGKRYRAVYDYAAADEDEVSFVDGDVIIDVQQIDEGWMYGRVERTGQQGMLPANYVEAV
ncbi:LIM and SH3 domain protein 1, partial [Dissostichus eleginoides]